MYSAGLLALLITFAFNQMQTKYLLVETEDNSEADPMPKEEVKAVLAALKFPEGIYNSLSKSSQQKIQKKLLKLYGNDKEEVIYIEDIEITSSDQIMLLFSLQAYFMCRFYNNNHQENIACNWSKVYIFICTIVLAVLILV